jgi:hypothetical protein
MGNETAEQLLADPSCRVRLDAMTFLASHGRSFTDAEARKLLVEPMQSGGLGLFFSSHGRSNEDHLDEFKHRQRKAASDRELEKFLDTSVFDREEEFVLAERRFAKYAPRLRIAVANLFKAEFDEALHRMEAAFPDRDDLVQKTKAWKRLYGNGIHVPV